MIGGGGRVGAIERGRTEEPALGRIKLHYQEWGDRAAEPLVLLHGSGMHGGVWGPYAASLGERYRVIAVDQRGHGDSPKPAEARDYHWVELAADLLALLDELDIGAPYVVGHSMGGAVTLLAEMARPGSIGRALLIDPIIMEESYYEGEHTLESDRLSAMTLKRRSRWASEREAIEGFAGKPPFATWEPEVLRAYVEGGTESDGEGGIRLKAPPAVEALTYLGSHAFNPWAGFGGVATPVRLLGGKNDDRAGWKQIRRMARTLPRAELFEYPEHSHFLPMENTKLVSDQILEFGAAATVRAREAEGRAAGPEGKRA